MALRLRRGTDAQRQLITPLSGELIYTTDTNEVYVGDGVTPGGNKSFGSIPTSIDDLDDVDITSTAPTAGQVLKWDSVEEKFVPADDIDTDTNLLLSTASIGDLGDVDLTISPSLDQVLAWNGSEFVPTDVLINDSSVVEGSNYRINIVSDDSSIMVNTDTNTFTGNFVGNLNGDVQGSVFGDDSTVLVDGNNNSFNIARANFTNTISFNNTTNAAQSDFDIITTDERSVLTLIRSSDIDLSGNTSIQYGNLAFARDDINGRLATSTIFGRENALFFGNSSDGVISTEDKYFVWRDNKFGIGEANPTEVLHANGNGIVTGTLNAGAFKGTLVADDSSIIIDGTTGSLIVANIDIIGTTGTPSVGAGDLANVNEWLQVTVNGNTRYIPLYA